jgi:predicted NAD/FAD-binding protein
MQSDNYLTKHELATYFSTRLSIPKAVSILASTQKTLHKYNITQIILHIFYKIAEYGECVSSQLYVTGSTANL